jgi:hypothetical protein
MLVPVSLADSKEEGEGASLSFRVSNVGIRAFVSTSGGVCVGETAREPEKQGAFRSSCALVTRCR